MTNLEERIKRMESNGVITPGQAAELRASTGDARRHVAGGRKKIPMGGAILASGLFLLVALWIATPGFDSATTEIQTVSEMMNDPDEVGSMNRNIAISVSLLVILLPVAFSVLGFVWINNNLVEREEAVLAGWSQVESNYQRRADLIPNLVETVRSFAEHEKELLTGITRERGLKDLDGAVAALKRSQRKVEELSANARENLDDEQFMQALASAQQAVEQQASHIFGLAENYPQLRSSDNFLALQDQLEGTENRVNIARMIFNDSVRDYNSSIRKLPASLVASLGGFTRKAYFVSEEGAESSVEVDLDTAD